MSTKFDNFTSVQRTNMIQKLLLFVVATGLILSLVVSWYVYQHNKERVKTYVELLSVETEELVKERFGHYEYGLHGARGLIVGASLNKLNRSVFEQYIQSRNLSKEFPGARGFGFIRRVPVDVEEQFLVQAQADGAPDFHIKELTPHKNERFVIQYIYPTDKNEGATGLDIASENNRRNAALASAKNGKSRLTAPITLVQAEGKKRHGFLALLPVYDYSMHLNSAQDRVKATMGWAYAPLVVDEVLADLGMQQKSIRLTITDKDEAVPFYENVKNVKSTALYNTTTKRTIEFMGRVWVLQASTLPTVVTTLGLWSPLWTGVLCLFLTSILSFILWIALIKNKYEHRTLAHINIKTFLRSVAVKKLLVGYIGIALIFIFIIAILRIPEQIREKSENLNSLAQHSKSIIERSNKEHKEDLKFLASTSAVSGLISVMQSNTAQAELLLVEQWKSRLTQIFKAYIISSPDVYQVRLIQKSPNGKEVVRVERIGDEIHVVPDDALQYKGQRSYLANTLALDKAEVWSSNIELNKENNELEIPYRPTYRYSSPVFDQQGILFGIVIINVDAKALLNEIKALSLKNEELYATNSTGDFIIHPDNNKLFSTDLETSYRWEKEFRPSSLLFHVETSMATIWKNEQGNVLVAETDFIPNTAKLLGKIEIKAVASVSKIYKDSFLILATYLSIFIAIGLLITIFFYFNWAHIQRTKVAEKQADQRKKNQMFESLIELSPEALIICDSTGKIEIINTQTEKLFRYNRDKMIGQYINVFIPDFDLELHNTIVTNKLSNTVVHAWADGLEIQGLDNEGNKFPIEISISPVQVEDKLLFASSIRDISERKHIEDTLRAASYEAERANHAKSSFLANMSHEIRTPLNAIIGITYLLKDEKLTHKQMSLVSTVQLAGRSLLGIVNDVLDLAKIEANEVTVVMSPCQLKNIINELFSVFAPQAETKNLVLNVEIDIDVPQKIMTDDKLLRQMLTNLLSNALKFTKKGHVTLSVRLRKTTITTYIVFEVSDTGIGISEEAQTQLFQPFSQAEERYNRQFGGTGLGLSIVRNMVELLGGDVVLSSRKGEGSQFSLLLPLVEPSSEELKAYGSKNEPLNVLIAEDDTNQRLKLESDCKSLGWRVRSVRNGAELVAKVKSYIDAGKVLPDVLLVDWQMPELDGLQALSLLSEDVGINKLPAVIIISAFEREKIAQLDAKDLAGNILQKPVDLSQLFNAVNDVVVKHTGNTERVFDSTQTEAIKAKWLLNVNVLVVDDSEINLDVVGNILERNGAIVHKATGGMDAIDYLKSTEQVDVVLMDIQMPEMDGLAATQYIREELKILALPIIALTAGTLMEEKRKSIAAGMNDFLTKPVEPAELIRSIRKLVEAYRGKVVSVESTGDTVRDVSDWPKIEGLEHDKDLLGGDLPFFISIIKKLFTEYEGISLFTDEDTAKVIAEEDNIVLANIVHKLRGSLGLIGALELFQLAGETEISLRLNKDNADELLQDFLQKFIKLRERCREFLMSYKEDQVRNNELLTDEQVPSTAIKIKELELLLKSNNIDALQFLEEHSQQISYLMGNENFEAFQRLTYNLEFEDALKFLKFSEEK